MSIKKLFDKNKPSAVLVSTNLEEEVVKNAPQLESADNVREQMERINRFIPQVDFSDPANFARYGSAEQYYEDALSRIQREYPYDGSEEEITRFQNESNYIDKYIFDSRYPRTTGYAIFSANGWGTRASTADGYGLPSTQEYIHIVGGPNTASGGMPTGKLHQQFTGSNYYDTDIYTKDGTLALGRVGSRESNLQFDWAKGQTIEFWLKKDAFITGSTQKEIIFDLWNGEPSGSNSYGRLTIFLSGSTDGTAPLRFLARSGSLETGLVNVLNGTPTTASVADGKWHHYALSIKNNSGTSTITSYLDSVKISSTGGGLDIQPVTGSLRARIGALITSPSGSSAVAGAGKLSGSIDEFRYWKAERTEKEIQENYWTQVRGGTNNEVANAELGVYYKFNEGITGVSSTDSTVLDYSGRITNGNWVGYASGARAIGSAINESTAVVSGTTEYKDPIVYAFHPDVLALKNELAASGSVHDYENQASIKDSLPSWMVEEDETKANGELKKLTQIVGSYFDTLQLQVERLPFLTDTTYDSASVKPLPFAQRLLTSRGLEAPEIFVDATLLEYFGNRKDDRAYSTDIHEVKNLIYQNIYNNLSYIYKSKGTEKAFRNLVRCYGIGDEIIKFNAYGNNTEFKFEDTFYDTTTRKNYADFNHPTRFGGIVYQTASSTSTTANGGAYTYVRGTNVDFANTAEVEVVFPRKLEVSNPEFFDTTFLSASIFGYHTTGSLTDTAFDFGPASDDKNFQLYFVRTHRESKDGYFQLKSRAGDFDVTSSIYSNVYDNQKWNFAVRFRNESWPQAGGVTGSQAKIVLDWYGVNTEYGMVKNSFQFTQSLDGVSDATLQQYLAGGRRYYAGADRTNFTGSVVTSTDLRISSIRHYLGFLENEVIVSHARDPENIGTKHPSKNILFTANDTSEGDDNVYIPQAVSLGLNWDFAQVTGTDSSGDFFVEDASSGSSGIAARYPNGNNTGYILGYQHAGAGYFPSAVSSTGVINKDYVPTAKQRLPEVVNSADSVNVMSGDDEFFPRDATISQTFFAFEKSMFGVISQEMVDMFGTIVDFNNLIGDIVHKYRSEHKDLEKLRNLFFEKVQNNPDLDKFIDFYKWIDQSLAIFLQQLTPASADVADEIRVVIEDHILGRSSYKHPYPLLDYKGNARWGGDEAKLEARVQGVRELTYDWEHGHAPLNNQQNTNALWWKDRALRTNDLFGTAAAIDSARQTINDIALSFNSASAETLVGTSGNYLGSTYAIRNFTNTLRLTPSISKEVKGGYNFPRNQRPDAAFSIIKRGSTADRVNSVVGSPKDIAIDERGPPILEVRRSKITDSLEARNNLNLNDYSSAKNSLVGILDLYSSSAETTSYRSQFGDTSFEVMGIHEDHYGGDYEVPAQGPFTEAHVGGSRHRHTALNQAGLDNATDRAEAFSLDPSTFRITANDSSFTKPSSSPQYRRDETAKRPLNIKNIQHTTASTKLGNFSHVYEVVQTSDRSINNSAFVKAEGFSTASIVSTFVTGVVDYTKPTRPPHKHVFVERFSAPGGPEVAGDNQGGAGLDVSSAQFSPYNNLNYRNLTVRQPLQTLLTERSERFGLRSGSAVSSADYTSVTASYHKINRNPLQRLETGSSGVVTASTFDNYYVQHMIPRSDYQYAWITSSHVSSNTNVYGYFPYDGFVSTSAGLIGAINFVSQSELGSGISGDKRRPKQKDETYDAGSFVATDFVGLNTTIVEPISASDFTLGYPLDANVLNYYNWGNIGHSEVGTNNSESFINRVNDTTTNTSYILSNVVTNNRNGPHGHPTWKQIRVGQGQLARYYRKNNLYTHTPDGGEIIDVPIAGGTTQIRGRYGATLLVSQSVTTTRFKPLVHTLQAKTGKTKKGRDKFSTIVLESTFGNSLVTFDNTDFANSIGLESNIQDTSYEQIKLLYLDGAMKDPSSPITNVENITYSEVVYPSNENMGNNKVRGRTNYYNDFWRDNRLDRYKRKYIFYRYNSGFGFPATDINADGAGQARDLLFEKNINSMGATPQQSVWVLDANENFVTEAQLKSFGGLAASTIYANNPGNNEDGHRPGELQNMYVHFLQRADPDSESTGFETNANRTRGILYSRKHIMPFTSSVTPAWQMRSTIPITSSVSDGRMLPSSSVGRGDAFWDASALAGKYEGGGGRQFDSDEELLNAAPPNFVAEERKPFYDDYEEFFADIKGLAKDYSVIPEFRISDHIDFYDMRDNDFLVSNEKMFRIVGTPTGSSNLASDGTKIPSNSEEANFFTIFNNSDFMKYFEVIREDHQDFAAPTSIKLRCRAIKKFVPYNGFYPAERTRLLAQRFSGSFGDYITYEGSSNLVAGTKAQQKSKMNLLTNTLFAPGILFNTIKSGLAVDYPVMTGSYNTGALYGLTGSDGSYANYATSASFSIMSNSRKVSKAGLSAGVVRPEADSISHNDGWDYRIPFEALLDPSEFLRGRKLVNQEPTEFGKYAENATASLGGEVNNRKYHNMMHNFLAETIDFFLEESECTKITSKPESEWGTMVPGQPYGMRIKMFRSSPGDRTTTGPWGDFPVPQNISGSGTNNFVMYSRPSAFGPPVGTHTGSSTAGLNAYYNTGSNEFSSVNAIYASHTPPYYDGEAWVDVVFYPSASIAETALNASGEFVPTLDDLHTLAYNATRGQVGDPNSPPGGPLEVFGVGSSRIGRQGTYIRKWRFDQEALAQYSDSSYFQTGSDFGPMAGPWANKWAMQADASLNIFEREGNRWKIQTKFETPMLNFNYLTTSDVTQVASTDAIANGGANSVIPRGMWHQFGRLPLDNEGVYIQVTDIPDNWLDNHPSSSIIHDPTGRFDFRNRISTGSTADFSSAEVSNINSALRGYRLPIDGVGKSTLGASDSDDYTTQKPLSLREVCGFDAERTKVGKIKNKKRVFESIVAIPFQEVGGERKFFPIQSPYSAVFSSTISPSVQRQVDLMEKYVFPPTFDFVQNRDVDPVAMYIFEFSHDFDQDDLSHIWQNLMPKLGVQAQPALATIEHPLLINEILGSPQEALDNTLAGGSPYRIQFPEKLQWMVFKVKQRAKKDYFAQIGKGERENIPFYSFNWPYDQFSLIELAQVQTDVNFTRTFGEEIQEIGEAIQDNFEQVSQAFDQPILPASGDTGPAVGEVAETVLENTSTATSEVVEVSIQNAQDQLNAPDIDPNVSGQGVSFAEGFELDL